jgi:hypothetical protein
LAVSLLIFAAHDGPRDPATARKIPNPPAGAAGIAAFPRIMLWAWEHPEDLSFIDPRDVGVSFLALTLYLPGDSVVVQPRLQPLKVPPGTALMATVRIETDRRSLPGAAPAMSPTQRAKTAAAIAELGRMSEVKGVQIDFDASVSERSFYRDLLNEVRRKLPRSMALSMTALASWCAGDAWLAGLPVDEAVPMLFRMGADRREILRDLTEGGDFRSAPCRESFGISTDEPAPKLPRGRRVYVFHPGPWSRQSTEKVIREVASWQ